MQPLPIVAFSALSPLGATLSDLRAARRAGRSGLSTSCQVLPGTTHAIGEVGVPLDVPLPAPYEEGSRAQRLLARCVAEVAEPIVALRERIGASRLAVVAATSASGNTELEQEFVPDEPFPFDYHHRQAFGSLAGLLRRLVGGRGPAWTVSTACSSGGNALLSAAKLLRAGLCDAVVVGSVDALCWTTYRGFSALKVMDPQPCRPLDGARRGMSLGEGAAVLVVARERGPEALTGPPVFLAGCGASSDAHHMTAPDPEGRGAAAAMVAALADAGLEAGDVGYVNLHGTGTPLNDVAEAAAVARVLPDGLPCSSTKGATGHLLGAAAGVEAVITLLALQDGRLPPNVHLDDIDPDVRIRVLREEEEAPGLRYAQSNSFAFGGNNSSLVFGVER